MKENEMKEKINILSWPVRGSLSLKATLTDWLYFLCMLAFWVRLYFTKEKTGAYLFPDFSDNVWKINYRPKELS